MTLQHMIHAIASSAAVNENERQSHVIVTELIVTAGRQKTCVILEYFKSPTGKLGQFIHMQQNMVLNSLSHLQMAVL